MTERVCTCKITGPAYGQTRWDARCPFHGDGGSMVAVVPIQSTRKLAERVMTDREHVLVNDAGFLEDV